MAAGRLPEPGSKLGPCLLSCQHRDCEAVRADSAYPCLSCGKPIGYGVRFYRDGDGLAHAACLEDAADAVKATAGGAA